MFWMWSVLKKFDYSAVTGHEFICQKLRGAVAKGRTVSAYLFSGPKGIGKKTVTAPFAAALLCDAPENGGPCHHCPSCKLLAAGNHPDYITLHIPDDKKSIGIETVREQLIQQVYILPFTSKRKVFVIENGDALTKEAQNALLKVLEEPPHYAVFLILTTAQNKLLETVRSRCLKLQFLPLKEEVCKAYFQTLSGYESDRRALAASFAQGVIGHGKAMLTDDAYYALYRETVAKLVALTKSRSALTDMQQFLTENKEKIEDIIDFMLVFLRDALRLSLAENTKLLCIDEQEALAAFSTRFSPDKLVRMMDACLFCRERLQQNAGFTVAGLELLTRIQEEMHD